MNIYDDLDFLVNTLYDYTYNKDKTDKCYKIESIVKKNIKIDDIKKGDDYDYEQVFKNLKFIDFVNNKILLKRSSGESHPVNIKISMYPNNINRNALDIGQNYGIGIKYILSEYVLNEINPYVILPILNFDISLKDIKKYSEIYVLIKKYFNELEEGSYFLVEIEEHYHKQLTLRQFIKENKIDKEIIRSLLFQVLYGLAKINEKLKNFRHNNLNLDSIYVYITDKTNNNKFNIGDTIFNIDDMGFEIKITDFENSNTSDYLNNKTTNKKLDNPYYDIHYILHDLYRELEKINKSEEFKEIFMDELVNEKYQNIDKDNFELDEEYFEATTVNVLTASYILKNNKIFKKYIKGSEISESESSDKKIDLSEIKTNTSSKNEEISESESIPTSEMSEETEEMSEEDVEVEMKGGGKKKSNKYIFSVSSFSNEKKDIRNFDIKENSIDLMSQSLTETITDNPRLLGKNIFLLKKKTSNIDNINTMMHGSRKLFVPQSKVSNMSDSVTISSIGGGKKKKSKKSSRKMKRYHAKSSSSSSYSPSHSSMSEMNPMKNYDGMNVFSEGLQNNLISKLPSGYQGFLPDGIVPGVPSAMDYMANPRGMLHASDFTQQAMPQMPSMGMPGMGSMGVPELGMGGKDGLAPPPGVPRMQDLQAIAMSQPMTAPSQPPQMPPMPQMPGMQMGGSAKYRINNDVLQQKLRFFF